MASDAATVHKRPVFNSTTKGASHYMPVVLHVSDATEALGEGEEKGAAYYSDNMFKVILGMPDPRACVILIGDTAGDQTSMWQMEELICP